MFESYFFYTQSLAVVDWELYSEARLLNSRTAPNRVIMDFLLNLYILTFSSSAKWRHTVVLQ